MNIGATLLRRRIVDRDAYQQESKPWPWWKYAVGTMGVAAFILVMALLYAVVVP